MKEKGGRLEEKLGDRVNGDEVSKMCRWRGLLIESDSR